MILKVNHGELENVSDVMIKDVDVCRKEINSMEQDIERLQTIWQGEDANIFCTNALNYIRKLKGIPESLETMSKFMDKSNEVYKKTDEEFGKKLETEALNDGKQ